MKSAILQLPTEEDQDEAQDKELEVLTIFPSEQYGNEIKTSEFHPVDKSRIMSVQERQLVLWDLSSGEARLSSNIPLEGRNSPSFTSGKWNPHQNGNQFATCVEGGLKTWDIRSGSISWNIDSAHAQLVRDLDFNPNKQYCVATCGDDGRLRIWDWRRANEPLFSRADHSHWIWCVRFNPFHDQLLLTASSDARVIVSGAGGVSSENAGLVPDGPLQHCEHEDSVYCCEWSSQHPWTFASLSYDGRLLISRVRRTYKYQILL